MASPGRLLVRAPSPRVADGIVSHHARQPVDATLARKQWETYVATLEQRGWSIEPVPELPDAPDGVFVEDTVVVFGDVAVVTRPGAPARREETTGIGGVMERLGLTVQHLQPPATLDGGDVLKVGDVVYVGRSARTNAAGVDQVRAIVEPRGRRVVEVPVTAALHLKSCVTALPDGTVIGYPPLVDDPSLFATFLEVPEESGAHVVVLDERAVLLAADCPETQRLLAARGFETVPVDISEFQKLDGCVTCLSVRVRATAT